MTRASSRLPSPRRRRGIVLGILPFLLLAGIATPPASAQESTPGWSGTVEVSSSSLRLTKGGSVSYGLRLTQLPTANSPNDWWVMIDVEADGMGIGSEGHGGIRWTPSVGWEIQDAPDATPDPDNPEATRWYTLTIYADENASVNHLSITHEVWDHESNCPIHGVGRVSVQVVNEGDGDNSGGNGGDGNGGDGNGGDGNGGGGGDGNGGDGNGGDGNGGDGNGGDGNGGDGNGGGGGNGDGSDGGGSGGGGAEAPRLFIGNAGSVAEGAEATFSVTLSARSTEAVTVGYRTLDGTAVAGADYRSTEGTLRFAAGETSQEIAVSVLDDELAERTEQFRVELGDPRGATVAVGTGAASIIDDDEPPAIAIDDAPPVNEGESAEFVVRLSAPAGTVVAVSHRTADGTAVAGADYRSSRGRLRFAAGETSQTIAVAVLDDGLSELTESFTVELHDPSLATLTDGSGLGTIVDDDEPPELVIEDAPDVAEGRSAVFPVRLSTAAGHLVTVAYRTADGSALGGADYTASDGTLRFEAGETRLAVAVPTLLDDLVEGIERFTVELGSPDGATIADGSGLGTITDDAEQRVEVVNRTVLPEIGRALAFSAVRCRIGGGFDAPPSRGGGVVGGISLAAASTTSGGRRAESVESQTFEQVLGASSFLLPSSDDEGDPGRFATWGCGDHRHLGGAGGRGAVAWDGEVFSLHVGADVRLGGGVLAGLSVSRSRGSFDYYAPDGAVEKGGGAYELRLVGVHPYLSWSVSSDVDLWGTVGHAWGQARIVDEVVGEPRTGAATLRSAAVGVSGRLLTRGATALRVNAEGALARMDMAGAPALDAVTVDMQRVRVSAETSHRFAFSSGVSLTPWGELGVRHDGGDGETGAGVEVGAGVRYRSTGSVWTVEGYGRRLVAHERALREWGVGALIRFAPESSGRGPSLSLLPSWGDPASGVDRLWEHGTAHPAGPGSLGTRVGAQFGYGFAALRGRGVVTPFGAVSVDEGQGRGYRLGWQLAVSRAARVSLEAERRERTAARVAHVVLVRGSVRF